VTAAPWLGDNRSALAANHILDVAAQLFLELGVTAVNMNQIATKAGCSRATLYRYFPSRSELQMSYVEREARNLSDKITEQMADIGDLEARITGAILAAVEGVRSDPVLHSWFNPDTAGLAGTLGSSSQLVNRMAVAFLSGDAADHADAVLHGQFMVRIIVSLLMTPGADAVQERELVERFVTPSVLAAL
jgi:AcrR family transcriptional regulator